MLSRGHIPLPAPGARSRLLAAACWVFLCFPASSATAQTPTSATRHAIRLAPPDSPNTAGAPAEIDPPLSIYESAQMLLRAAKILPEDPAALTTATMRQIDRMLYTVVVYVERVDRSHPTLPFYAWEEVSSEKAPRNGWQTQTFRLVTPIPQVTALSILARHGDVEIKYLAAVDKNQTRWEFNQSIRVPAGSPRPEICFLPLPTQLAEVCLTSRRSDPDKPWPRIFIQAGISSIPESAKEANYYLQLARGALKERKITECRGHIRNAYRHLREYQINRRF